MKKLFCTALIAVVIASCGKDPKNLMTVSGTIDGLKKGTLFLQKIQDSVLTDIDSLVIKGDANFSFKYEIQTPEIFYLYLQKADYNDINDRVIFFGQEGSITINTKWNRFDSDAEITGSALHKQFASCKDMLSKFNTKELEFAKLQMTPEIQGDSSALDSLIRLSNRNILGRYKYILNFALTNTDSYVTPYLALTEVADANPTYLDSINNNLSAEVASSKYGKALDHYVKSLKK